MLKEKHHIRYILVPFIYLMAFFIYPISSIAASLYNITDIGPLKLTGYDNQNLRLKINNNNQIIGWHRKAHSSISPMVGLNGENTSKLLEPLSSNSEHAFYGSNNLNITVGIATDADNNKIAVMWNADFTTQTNLNNLGGVGTQANDINSSNHIVGNSQDSNGITQPFLWINDAVTQIPINNNLGGTASVINDNDWLTGSINTNTSTCAGPRTQAYFWDGTQTSILSDVNIDVSSSWASDLNNLNQVVGGMHIFQIPGSSNCQDSRTKAYVWNKTTGLTNIGQNILGYSWAIGINDSQQIVGGRLNYENKRDAIIWEDSTAFNLNNLVLNKDNWELEDATDININGNIVGIGKRNGLSHAFLLEPSGGTTPTSDLEISLSSTNANNKARALNPNENQTLSYIITNHGPDEASNVNFESRLNSLLSITYFSIENGDCTITNTIINCEIPTLALNESVALSLELNTDVPDDYQIDAEVKANEIDAGINANNAVSKTLKVVSQIPAQQSSTPDQNTSTDESTNDKTSEIPESSDENKVNPNPQESSSTGGCSLGTNQAIDPLFFLLLVISILRIIRNNPHKTRNM